jgi:hypothetical protein
VRSHLRGEEVGTGDRPPVRPEERSPGGGALRDRCEAVCLKIRAMVDRPTRWCTCLSAPWIRVWPQVGFSSAMRTTSC